MHNLTVAQSTVEQATGTLGMGMYLLTGLRAERREELALNA